MKPAMRTGAVRALAAGLLVAALASFSVSGALAAAAAGTAKPPSVEPPGRELILIPSTVPGLSMRAYLFRPPGRGPFPLAIINHGSEEDSRRRTRMAMPSFGALTAWFLAHGYAVLIPERPGHGATGGPYLETQGKCRSADYVKSGLATADSIAAAIDYMAHQTFIRPSGVVVVGNSAGGWGAIALASRNPKNVAAVINFAGGRGGRDHDRAGANCSPDRLVAAAGTFGKTARVPTLWLYAANDTYFAPELSGRMAEAFRAAGGRIEYHLLPAIKGEGHALVQTSGPLAPWLPYVEAFVRNPRKAH